MAFHRRSKDGHVVWYRYYPGDIRPLRHPCWKCPYSSTGYIAWHFDYNHEGTPQYVCDKHAETTFEMRCLESVTG